MKRILKEPEPEKETTQETVDDLNELNTLDICIIRATPLARLAKKPKYTIFAVTMADIKKALALKKHTDPAIKVLIEYYNLLDVFLRKEADKLPER
jgi:hypothetical protein